jgi:hypothetical protein
MALLLALTACGGGGGGGGGTTTEVPPPQSSLVFTPGAASASGISLASGAGSGPTTLVLEIRANSVQSLYGVAFDLSFPANLLRLDASARGSFLGDESNTTLALVQSTPGNLVIGLSRLGTLPGVSGSGVLLTLRFTSLTSGSGAFAFTRNSAVDAAGSPLSGLSWSGGSVQVTVVPAA